VDKGGGGSERWEQKKILETGAGGQKRKKPTAEMEQRRGLRKRKVAGSECMGVRGGPPLGMSVRGTWKSA